MNESVKTYESKLIVAVTCNACVESTVPPPQVLTTSHSTRYIDRKPIPDRYQVTTDGPIMEPDYTHLFESLVTLLVYDNQYYFTSTR